MSAVRKISRKKKAVLKNKQKPNLKIVSRKDAQESANFEETPAWAAGLMQTVKDISQRMDEIEVKTKGGVPAEEEEEEIEEEEEEIEEEEEEIEEEEEEIEEEDRTAVAKDAAEDADSSADNGSIAGREFKEEEEEEEVGSEDDFEGEGESPVTASPSEQKSLQRSKSAPSRAEYDVKLEDGVLSLTSSGQSRQDLRGHKSKSVSRMDATIKKQSAEIAQLKKLVNKIYKRPSIDDANKIASARKRADALYTALGRNVPEHLYGESVRAYRARLADGLKDLSSTLKKTVFDALPLDVFGVAEEKVYQDAMSAIKTQSSDIKSVLRAHKYVDETGHNITEYYGNNADWMKPFMSPGFVSKINRQQGAK